MPLLSTFSFVFLYLRHGSVCSTTKVLLTNVIVLLHFNSPIQSSQAQSSDDTLAMCHGYPQCHKNVIAECHIIFPAQFFIHSNAVTSHCRSVSLTVHSSPSNKQTTLNATLSTLNPTSHHCYQHNCTRTAITTLHLHTPEHNPVHRQQSDRSYGLFRNVTAVRYCAGYCHNTVTVLWWLPVAGVG